MLKLNFWLQNTFKDYTMTEVDYNDEDMFYQTWGN